MTKNCRSNSVARPNTI